MSDPKPNHRSPEDLLDQAIASWREQADMAAASHGEPTPRLVQRTLARVTAEEEQANQPTQPFWRTLIMKPAFRLSAAAVLALTILGAVLLFALRPGVTFADVLAKVAAVKSVSFKMTGTVAVAGAAPQQVNSETLIVEPARMRTVTHLTGIANVTMIQISDQRAGKTLTLDPANKIATLLNVTDQPKEMTGANLLENIKNYDARNFEQIGKKEIAGRSAIGYRPKAQTAGAPMQQTIWVDEQTQLPIQIDMAMKNALIPDSTMVMSDFKWDVPYDEESLSLTPPPGYQARDPMTMAGSVPTEKDLVDALQAAAELNDNAFPDRFDMPTIIQLVTRPFDAAKRADPKATLDPNSPEIKATQTKMIGIIRALGFAIRPDLGTDWHYAGKGIKLNQPNTPVMWYRPASSESYRVIDADLKVREVKVGDLPNVPSEPMNAGLPTPTTRPGG